MTDAGSRDLGPGLLLAAVLVRCGAVPAHCWVTDWFEHSSFGNALLFVAPLTGVYAAVRLLLPAAPDWALPLRRLQSGHVGDYVAWVLVGAALLGALALPGVSGGG